MQRMVGSIPEAGLMAGFLSPHAFRSSNVVPNLPIITRGVTDPESLVILDQIQRGEFTGDLQAAMRQIGLVRRT